VAKKGESIEIARCRRRPKLYWCRGMGGACGLQQLRQEVRSFNQPQHERAPVDFPFPRRRIRAMRGRGCGRRVRGRRQWPPRVSEYGVREKIRIDRLGDVVDHARGEAPGAFFRHDMGADADDRQVWVLRLDEVRGFAPVHLGHLHVHQYGVEGGRSRCNALHGDAAVFSEFA
jgi:hypothetical protein